MPADAGRDAVTYRLVALRSGKTVAAAVRRVTSPAGIALGLLGRRSPGPGRGLWLDPCNGVHTLGMRYALDVVALSADRAVVRVWLAVPPWRVLLPVAGCRSTVELAARSLGPSDLVPGDKVEFVPRRESG